MATLDAGGNAIDITMAFGDEVNHAAQGAPTTSSQYNWTTTSGNSITAFSFADNITFNATVATGGSVHALSVTNSYVVGGMFGNLVTMTAAPNTENYWRTILAGATTIFASAFASFNGDGDFLIVSAGETKTGADDLFEGIAPAANDFQSFNGDADGVQNQGVLAGGDDTINMRADGDISGDIFSVAGKLTGGADTIVIDDVGINDQGTQITGDAFSITDNEQPIAPILVGGADTIIVKNYGGSGGITGDLFNTFAALGVSNGGKDTIDASDDAGFLEAYGDVAVLSNGTFRGGGDTMIASDTGNAQFAGDAGIVSGGQLQAGADNITGGAGGDTLMGEFITQSGGSVIINATFTGDDTVYGAGGGDVIRGQVGDDILDGGFGDDILDGGSNTAGPGDVASFATLNVGVSADLNLGFAFGQGNDSLVNFESLRGSNQQDSLGGSATANRLEGLIGDDQLMGRGGGDTLLGGFGADTMKGFSGNDTLTGGSGADDLNGGLNNDVFDYNGIGESGVTAASRDVIAGFSQSVASGDIVDLNTIDARAGTAGNQNFVFIGNAAFSAEGQVRFGNPGGITLIEVNTTGVSGADMSIEIAGVFALLGSDFVL